MKRRIAFAVTVALLALLAIWLLPTQSKPAPTSTATSSSQKARSRPQKPPKAPTPRDLRRVYLEVQSKDHAPIGGAQVQVIGVGTNLHAETDASGLVVLEDIPTHVGRLSVYADGYLDKTLFQPKFPDAPEFSWTVVLTPDDAELDEGLRRIRGVVLSDGAPVAEATILLNVAAGAQVNAPASLMTKSSPRGRFHLDVPKALPVTSVTALHIAHGEATAPVKTDDEVVLQLPASAYVEGKVTDSRGQPIDTFYIGAAPDFITASKSYRVMAGRIWQARRKNRKDPNTRRQSSELKRLGGGVELRLPQDAKKMGLGDNVPPGVFRLGPFAPGSLSMVAGSDAYEPDRQKVELTAGETRRGVVFVLQDPLVVTGVVTDAKTGEPIARARVTATSVDRAVPGFGTALTDADGQYRLVTSSAVRQTLTAKARGYFSLDTGGVEGSAGDTLVRDIALSRKDRRSRHKRQYVGIGAQLKQVEDGVLVVKVLDNGAARDFLDAGDVIVRVDGEWVDDLPLRETVQAILGEPDTEVELEVRRAGQSQTETVVIPRQRVTTSLR